MCIQVARIKYYPPGKWFFYERVLGVPNYIIFEPDTEELEVYQAEGASCGLLSNQAEIRYYKSHHIDRENCL
jgi:Uma2 family endonuclease